MTKLANDGGSYKALRMCALILTIIVRNVLGNIFSHHSVFLFFFNFQDGSQALLLQNG